MWKVSVMTVFTRFIWMYVFLGVIGLMFSSPSLAVIDPGTVVGAWFFEEGGGKTVKDSSGGGNDGTIEGAPKWVKGQFGNALEFDGKKDYIIIAHSDTLNLNEMTVAAWVHLRSYPDDARIITKEEGVVAPWTVYSLQMSGAGESKLEFRPTINGQRQRVASNEDVPLNEWTHIAATFDGKEVVLYLNGEIDQKAPHAGEMMQNEKDLWFGASEFWDPRFFDGLMDDVALFNVALSQDDIKTLVKKGLAAELGVSLAGKLATTWAQLKRP